MATRLSNEFGKLRQRPRLAVLLLILLGLLGYLGWLGGCILWVRWDRSKAEEALAEYDFSEARRRLSRCIRLRPQDASLRLLAVQTARRDGDLDYAEEQLEVYRDLIGESSSPEVLERALRRAQQGKVQEVLDFLIEALEVRHPQSEQILEALTIGCIHSYQLNRVVFWNNELLEKWPKNAIGRFLRAETTDTQGNRDKALALFQDLVKDYPKFFKARLSLAGILFKSARYHEAIPEYVTLLQQRPTDLYSLLGLASSYDRIELTEQALHLLAQLQKHYPDNSEVLLLAGHFALNEKRLTDAEEILRRAVALAPNDHEIHRELGICLERLGKPEESRKHMEQFKRIELDLVLLEKTVAAMSKAPNDPELRREAGEICLRNGNVAEGLRWLHGVLESTPKDKATHQVLADFYSSRGDSERAAYHSQMAR